MRFFRLYIAIEGNIGAGKSTVINNLARHLNFEVIEEGIESDEGFQQHLAELYDGYTKKAFDAIQHYLANYRANIINKLDPNKNYIMERSIQGAALFCIAESHTDTATWTLQNFKDIEQPSHYLYLDCPAEICAERILNRGRECEQDIPFEYLKRLEKAHRDWGYMSSWAGQTLIVDSSTQVDTAELSKNLENTLRIKGAL